jgi:methylmalonyl-CoA mutase cobalamin-binding subunit
MSHDHAITRRDFVRGTVGAVVGASALCGAAAEAAAGQTKSAARAGRSAHVVLVRDEKALNDTHDVDTTVLDRMLADTVVRLTGEKTPKAAWLALFKPTDTVGLVPTPHLNPTHGELVEAVRRALRDAGVPAGQIREAQGGIELPRACTALIAMPALKAHWLTGLGTAMKIYIMYSGRPSSYHDANNANLAETWLLPGVKGKTRLVLVDALRPLCDKGPQPDPRYLWDYKGLIASTDPVAVDAVGLQIVMAKRRALRGEDWPLSPPPLCVAAADEKFGLGTSRMSEIKLERAGWAHDVLV